MTEPEIPLISELFAGILRERYVQPHPFPTLPITLALLRQEVHDMLPDLNPLALPPLKNGVHPPFQLTVLVQIPEPEPPLELEQIRRRV